MFAILSTIFNSCILLVPPVEKTYPKHTIALLDNITRLCSQNNASITLYCQTSKFTSEFCTTTRTSTFHEAAETAVPSCVNMWNNNQSTMEPEAANISYISCVFSCRERIEDYMEGEGELKSYGKTFWWIFVLFFISQNCYFVIFVLLYGMIYAQLGDRRQLFGRQRVWGTIGKNV